MSHAKTARIKGTSDGGLQSNLSRGRCGQPKAAFTTRRKLQAYLRHRLDVFINPLVYTFWDNQGTPSIMTMSAALSE
jgi:hypothetical protein